VNWIRKRASFRFFVLISLFVYGVSIGAGEDIAQFNHYIDTAMRQLGMKGNHSQLPADVRRMVHDSLQGYKEANGRVDSSLVMELLAENQGKAVKLAKKGSRAARWAKRAQKGAYGFGLGLVLVATVSAATGDPPTWTDVGGAIPVVGIPITVYAVADEVIEEELNSILAAYSGLELSKQRLYASVLNNAARFSQKIMREAEQPCSDGKCEYIYVDKMQDCLRQLLDQSSSVMARIAEGKYLYDKTKYNSPIEAAKANTQSFYNECLQNAVQRAASSPPGPAY